MDSGYQLPLQASKLIGKTTTYDSDGNPVDTFESDMSEIMQVKGDRRGTMNIKKTALDDLYNPEVNYLKSVIRKPELGIKSIVDEF